MASAHSPTTPEVEAGGAGVWSQPGLCVCGVKQKTNKEMKTTVTTINPFHVPERSAAPSPAASAQWPCSHWLSETTGGPEPWPNPELAQTAGPAASSDPALPGPSHHPGGARAQLQKGGPHPPHASDPLRNKERSCYKGPCGPSSAGWGENRVWMETGGRGRPHTALSSHSKMCRKPVHAGSKLRGRSRFHGLHL